MKLFSILLCVLLLLLVVSCSTGEGKNPRLHDAVKFSVYSSKSMTEGRRTVKGRIVFESESDGSVTSARIALPFGRQIHTRWPYWVKPKPLINPFQKYSIELLTIISTSPDYILNEVSSVSENDQVILNASICKVHEMVMVRQIEDEKSACAYPDSFYPIHKKNFPNDGNSYAACGSGLKYPVWKCPECSKKYHQWTKRHGVDESI